MSLSERLWGHEPQKKSTTEIKQELQVLITDLVRINSDVQILVFGSVARHEATEFSDIDLAIIVSDETDKKEFRKLFYKNRSAFKTPTDFIFRNRSEYNKKIQTNPIDQEIKNTGVEIYPQWKLND